jgi:hypothetical protein
MTQAPAPGADQDAAADRLLEDWLAAVAARLPGLSRTRRAVVMELRDGLHEALDAHRVRGLDPVPAAQASLVEFGDPGQIARAFAPELAAAHARRVALTLVRTGPLLGALWITALLASPLSTPPMADPAAPWRWPWPQGPWAGLPVLGLVLLIGVPAAVLAVAATGRLSRWLPAGPRVAPTAAAAAALAGMTVDLALLGMLSAQAFISPRQLAWTPATAAAAASLIRLALAGRATRRCLASRSLVAQRVTP